jgi:hypothetical protein
LPAYRRVAVFARICGTRTDLSPAPRVGFRRDASTDSGEGASTDSGETGRGSRWRRIRTTLATHTSTAPGIPRVALAPCIARAPCVACSCHRPGGARAAAAPGPAGRPAPGPAGDLRRSPARNTSRAIRASWSILSLIGPRLHPSNTLGVSDMQICYSPATR